MVQRLAEIEERMKMIDEIHSSVIDIQYRLTTMQKEWFGFTPSDSTVLSRPKTPPPPARIDDERITRVIVNSTIDAFDPTDFRRDDPDEGIKIGPEELE